MDPKSFTSDTANSTSSKIINEYGDINLHVKSNKGTRILRVSSSQLMVSSPFFAKMLSPTSQFAEAADFRRHCEENGANPDTPFDLHIDMEEKTLEGVEIVLMIFHGRPHGFTSSQVNNGDWLYSIAAVIDYLDCGPVMKDWGNIWLQGISGAQSHLRNLDKWIFITEIFQKGNCFKDFTKQAILRAYTMSDTEDLFWHVGGSEEETPGMAGPVFVASHPAVIAAIMEKRKALGQWFAGKLLPLEARYDYYPIYGFIMREESIKFRCRSRLAACDHLNSGFMRHLNHRLRLHDWAIDARLVPGHTIDQLACILQKVTVPQYNTDDDYRYESDHYSCQAFQEDLLQHDIREKLNALEGLDIYDFVHSDV